MPILKDIKEMPGFNSEVKNGISSVSEDKVFWGKLESDKVGLDTVTCREHGACLCVAVTKQGRLYRCPTCNQGAFVIKRKKRRRRTFWERFWW